MGGRWSRVDKDGEGMSIYCTWEGSGRVQGWTRLRGVFDAVKGESGFIMSRSGGVECHVVRLLKEESVCSEVIECVD